MAVRLKYNAKHFDKTHKRWLKRRNRVQGAPEYLDEWCRQQCLFCQYYIQLTAQFELDWGACSNPESEFDGIVRFEHDGCEFFRAEDEKKRIRQNLV